MTVDMTMKRRSTGCLRRSSFLSTKSSVGSGGSGKVRVDACTTKKREGL